MSWQARRRPTIGRRGRGGGRREEDGNGDGLQPGSAIHGPIRWTSLGQGTFARRSCRRRRGPVSGFSIDKEPLRVGSRCYPSQLSGNLFFACGGICIGRTGRRAGFISVVEIGRADGRWRHTPIVVMSQRGRSLMGKVRVGQCGRRQGLVHRVPLARHGGRSMSAEVGKESRLSRGLRLGFGGRAIASSTTAAMIAAQAADPEEILHPTGEMAVRAVAAFAGVTGERVDVPLLRRWHRRLIRP